jgi:prepilin-type N-terminal cleavage/methylation domain-containing protein
MIRRGTRTGFTLLEVLLAMSIGLLLMGALYVVVDTQLKHAQAAREVVEQSTLARALLTRIDNDISSSITLSDPGRFRNQNNAANSAAAAGGAGAGTGMGGMGATGMGTTGSTGTGNANATTVPLGIIGDATSLHIFTTKLPRDAIKLRGSDTLAITSSDTRRISYWLIGEPGNGMGLAKQEVSQVTSDDALLNLPPDVDENSYKVISDEVRSLTFSYFDGTTWNDTWPVNQFEADGVTPTGSPVAISIDIELAGVGGPDAPTKHYRHVVAIATANGTTPAPQNSSTTGGGTSP